LPDIRYQPPLLATGFYLNEAANEQSGQNDRSMRHSRNSFAAYLQRRDERRGPIRARGRLACRRRVGLLGTGANDGVWMIATDGAMARVEVVTGPERRGRWNDEQKRVMVGKSEPPSCIPS
jgi:hypothetical protein